MRSFLVRLGLPAGDPLLSTLCYCKIRACPFELLSCVILFGKQNAVAPKGSKRATSLDWEDANEVG